MFRLGRIVATASCLLLCVIQLSQHVNAALTPDEYELRKAVKGFAFGGLTLQRAQQISTGEQEPIERADVEDFLVLNWALKKNSIKKLEDQLNLDALGLHLSKVKLLDGDARDYSLSFRVGQYQTTLGTTTRAEWVTYVNTAEDHSPRVMVVENVDIDDYQCNDKACELKTSDGMHLAFQADESSETLHEQWIKAFDYKFGLSGLISKMYYNGSLIKAPLCTLSEDLTLVEQSPYAHLVELEHPESAFLFSETVIFGEIVKDPTLFANYIEPTFAEGTGISQGLIDEASVSLKQDVSNEPNYFASFEIHQDKIAWLEAAIGLTIQDKLTLVPVQLTRNGPKKYILVVNVYNAVGVTSGFRAEWSVFVKRRDDPDAVPYFLIIEASSSQGSLDQVDLVTPPAEKFDLTIDDEDISTTDLKDGATEFTATIPLHPKEQCKGSNGKGKGKGTLHPTDAPTPHATGKGKGKGKGKVSHTHKDLLHSCLSCANVYSIQDRKRLSVGPTFSLNSRAYHLIFSSSGQRKRKG